MLRFRSRAAGILRYFRTISMNSKFRPWAVAVYSILGTAVVLAVAQVADFPGQQQERAERERGPRPGGPGFGRQGGPPGRGGGGGFGGVAQDFPLRKQFDKNGDKVLNAEERAAAREFLRKEIAEGRGPRRGPMFGSKGESTSAPGKKLTPADVKAFADEPLYDSGILRTIFLEFESDDWEKELGDFYHTDVEVPARVTVDGKTYPDVGVHVRGASSFFTVREYGQKTSLVLAMDFVHEKQNLLGYRTIDLLNAHTDPSFLRSALYLHIAREYLPAAKANFARVVINGESWGIYVSVEHFNKDFVNARFPKTKGPRWKVPGSPRGRGGLEYLGDDIAAYKSIYEIKTKDDPASWQQLIRLCRVLSQTDLDKLETELNKVLDVDGALKFLALENALINSDGYWIRSSDYNLCQDENGRFHILPHDTNETFNPPGRPGGRRGEGEPPSANLNPLEGADDTSKPLLNRLLQVKNLRAKYFGYLRQIAEQSMDWNRLGPVATKYRDLIADDVKADTKKLYGNDEFDRSLSEDGQGRGRMGIREFVEKRRAFLLDHPEVKKASLPAPPKS